VPPVLPDQGEVELCVLTNIESYLGFETDAVDLTV